MLVKTKYFGEIDLDEGKVLMFDKGILGFEDYTRYTILFDIEKGKDSYISWLQSLDEQSLAIPVMDPRLVKPDYNPTVEDELLTGLGNLTEENQVVLVTVTVPADVKRMTVNLKAPIVINSDELKGCQVIAENQDYQIKFPFYDILLKAKEGGCLC